ncbi:VOC family protein [Agromyces sp. CFH 90414]|uniref:VOC family protein n=1 Tax=Agromyces agglutinans TaxID=2662258 RepID=A0A6I2F5C7_9MICO|nr:VOC family protein [Agromyces agglutinans]MRG59471.1 VOC family protein [Agromyces agglutinans]
MLRGIATVNVYVEDPAATAAWYAQVLGFDPYFHREGPDGRTAYVEFRVGDLEQELGFIDRRYAPAGLSAPGEGEVAAGPLIHWHVDDLEGTLARLVELGATPLLPITEHGPGFITASVVDPFGTTLGIMTNVHYLEQVGERSAVGD